MKNQHNQFNRRDFLKKAGIVGLAPVLASAEIKTDANTPKAQKTRKPQVPKRKLGKTGVEVSSLGLGTNRLDSQIILRRAIDMGVTCWDTAHSYVGGNSEREIGKLLSKSPKLRKKLFLITKASFANTIEQKEKYLHESLERMNTDYIDLYYAIHGLSDPAMLTNKLKQWVESIKKRGLIRFVGFSTHSNMPQCLTAAARVGWIDALTTSYNFRLMQNDELTAAVETCHKAGVGLITMKSVALTFKERDMLEAGKKIETDKDKKLLKRFLEKGFAEGPAKIKTVLEDERISSACVGMNNVALLNSNVAGVLGRTKLTRADRDIFAEYARATCSSYCAGCAHICNSALPETPYISEIARYLMYYNSYGDKDKARELFAKIPGKVRGKLLSTDYSLAEACCPQHIRIAELVAEAVDKLA
ncbi:MAG: aldo/keto reductase [Planctomycetota bacterium]|jgi:predicted aldo/keto reductase-like oxidoreductase